MSAMPRPARSTCSGAPRKPGCMTGTWPDGFSGPAVNATSTPTARSREELLMSSHREAPEISKDPVADSTDVYAFVSPDKPSTVTLIANYIPLQEPAGGPNFYEFGSGIRYEIHIDNNGDGEADITYQFHFRTELQTPSSFL